MHLSDNVIGAVKPGAQREGAAPQVDLRASPLEQRQTKRARLRGDGTLAHRQRAEALMSLGRWRHSIATCRSANVGARQMAKPSVHSLNAEQRIVLLRHLAWRPTRDTDLGDTGSVDAVLMGEASRCGSALTTCPYQSLHALATLAGAPPMALYAPWAGAQQAGVDAARWLVKKPGQRQR